MGRVLPDGECAPLPRSAPEPRSGCGGVRGALWTFGSSSVHKRPSAGHSGCSVPLVVEYPQGTYLAVMPSRRSQCVRPYNRAKRGRIRCLSAKSRKNLQRKLGIVKRTETAKALFVTLTWHEGWGSDWRAWKAALAAFARRLERRYPHMAFVWRMEAQRRGAPHFHLIVYNVPWLSAKTVARWWAEVIDAADDKMQIESGTEVRRVKSQGQAVGYVAKYTSKDEGYEFRAWDGGTVVEETGRLWGVVNRRYLPESICRVWRVPSLTSADGRLRHRIRGMVGCIEDVPWTQKWGVQVAPSKRLNLSNYGWLMSAWDGEHRRIATVTTEQVEAALRALAPPLHAETVQDVCVDLPFPAIERMFA